jgi:hypothetical protein
VKKKLLDYLGKLKENAVYVGKLKENAVYVGLFITSIIVVIVLQFAGDIYPPPMPIHARYKSRLCVPKFHLILIN